MAKNKNRKKKLSVLFARSKIIGIFSGLASFFYNKANSSLTGKFFSEYEKTSPEKSNFKKIADKADLGKRFFRPVKRVMSRLISRSVILNYLSNFTESFLHIGLNVYGLFFMTAGIGFFCVSALKLYVVNGLRLSFVNTFLSLLMFLLSIPLLLSKANFTQAVCESKSASYVIFDLLGGKRETFEKESDALGDGRWALLLGILLSVLSWWSTPFSLMFTILLLVIGITVLYTPETGMVLLLIVLPFLPSNILNRYIVYITLCFFLKYIRGKRTFKLDSFGVGVLMYAVLSLVSFSPLVSGDIIRPAYFNYLCLFFAFFLMINLIKSKEWVNRCLSALCLSCFAVVFYGIFRYVVSNAGYDYFISVLKCGYDEEMISIFASPKVFSNYLVLMFPILIVGGCHSLKSTNTLSLFGIVGAGLCVFLINDYSAYLAIILGIVVFMVIYGKKTLALLFGGVCLSPFVYYNLSEEIVSKLSLSTEFLSEFTGRIAEAFESVGSNVFYLLFGSGVGTLDYFYRYAGTYGIFYKMLIEIGLIGVFLFITCVFLVFRKNTTLYSKGCSKDGKLISLGAFASILSLLFVGINSNVFENQTVAMMFWIIFALSSCVGSTEKIIDDEY